MNSDIQKFKDLGQDMMLYGHDVVLSLFILVAGLIAAKMLSKYFKVLLQKATENESVVSTASASFQVFLVVLVVVMASHYIGVPNLVIRRLFLSATLIVVGMIVLFRPLIPSLPYKVGNTIEVGGKLGKVEATTLIHTRLRTFDGKTLFIPNRMILNDIVNNFHFTPSRRITMNVPISYHDDIGLAKGILKKILVEDPRVLEKPAPRVYVVNLGEKGPELSARGWVVNTKFFKTRSDCFEKAKRLFDQAGITIPFPQRTLHIKRRIATGDFTRAPIKVEDSKPPLQPDDHSGGGGSVALDVPEAEDQS